MTRAAASAPMDDPRELFGWQFYDWAHSAYVTTVGTVLMGPYLTSISQAAVGENGNVLALGPLHVTAKSLFADTVALSVFLQVFLLPVLGALADYTNLKKRLMAAFCFTGAAATVLLFFVTPGLHWLGALLFLIANLCFGASVVLYNAYLGEISSPARRDAVSSRGFALGYLGGGLLLALNLALVQLGPRYGIPTGLAVRLSLASAGLWWGGFAVFAFSRLHERGAARLLPPGVSPLRASLVEVGHTFRELRRLPQTARFLVGYLLYNDGIQTVTAMSSVFLAQELFVAQGREPSQTFLISLILVVQFVAFAGALAFERIAAWIGTKHAILVTLVLWSGVVVYAYGLLQTEAQAWAMGVVIALVLGGSQALSRSLFSRMIPEGKEASFFGLYEISERGTSWIGPLIFGRVVATTGSYRDAILSVIVLFISGMVILAVTNTTRAMQDAAEAPSQAESALPAEIVR